MAEERVFPLVDERRAGLQLPDVQKMLPVVPGRLTDALGRPLRDLRISVTGWRGCFWRTACARYALPAASRC